MEEKEKEDTTTLMDKIMVVIALISLLAFPLIIIEEIWFDYLPSTKLMLTDLTLGLVWIFYFKVKGDYEKENK